MPKTEGSVWSFDLHSYNPNDFSDTESDDALPDNLCSDGSTLVDQPLSEDLDTAVFNPNPWSIAKIHAASRPVQKSQESYDVQTISKRGNASEKKQPQGRIVDFWKKQAQQPSSSKGSGLRPLDAPLSRNTKKSEDPSKRDRDYISSTVDSTRQLYNGPCDADPLSMSRRTIHTNTAPRESSFNMRTDPIFSIPGDCATQSSGASRSGSLFQSAQDLSTRASIGRSCVVDGASEHCSGMLSWSTIPPQHEALAASGAPYGRPGFSDLFIDQISTSVHNDSTPFRTCLPLDVSNPFAPSQASTHMSAQEPSAIGTTCTRHGFVDEQDAFPTKYSQGSQMKLSEARPPQPQGGGLSNVGSRPRSQSAVAVSASKSKLDFPTLTNQPRSSAPASEYLPAMSRNQLETDKPPKYTPVDRRARTPGLPTPRPRLASASGLAVRRTGESAYDHPALRPATDDDAEWSTLPKRRPPSSVQMKDTIASSAKFFLPTRTRTPPPMEFREVETGKRPRITLYRPPPRTAAIDLAGLESRYACVRSSMRK